MRTGCWRKPACPSLLGRVRFSAQRSKSSRYRGGRRQRLITGDTGTGKELCARAIHQLGSRAGLAFVAVNCATLTAELAANDLFGHVAGGYTSAALPGEGFVKAADGGILFLDELNSPPMAVQGKLLAPPSALPAFCIAPGLRVFRLSPESEGCLVAPAVFKTAVGMLARRGVFDSLPLRHFFS
jgi:hypothetical protein